MSTLLLGPAAALLGTILLVAMLRPIAPAVGLVDRPGGRKMHAIETPVVGGLAMAGALALAATITGALEAEQGWFFLSIATLVGLGALDDRCDLDPRLRLAVQASAALAMVYGAGVVAHDAGFDVGGERIDFGRWAVPLTVLVVVGAVNAFNMFDGSDGVAGAQALVGLAFLAIACLAAGTPLPPELALVMGCVAGFLVFNWPAERTRHVRVFMGDAGSTMLGFAVAWLCIRTSQGPGRVITPGVALWLFALPLFDLISCMLRRIRNGRSPFSADAEHFHHVLGRWGLGARGIALVVVGTSALFAGAATAAHLAGCGGGTLIASWLAGAAAFHLVFGSGLVVRRRAEPQDAGARTPLPSGVERRRRRPRAARPPAMMPAPRRRYWR